MKTYIMKCGCRLVREELVRSQAAGYRCPNHPDQGTDYIEIECIDCGKIFIVPPRSQGAVRCEVCRDTHKKERQKKADAKRRDPAFKTKRKKLEDAAAAAWDCVNRSECLTAIVRDPRAQLLPCYKCERYQRACVVNEAV